MATNTTTPQAIRERQRDLIEGLTPSQMPAVTFSEYDYAETLEEFAEQNPSTCLRKFLIQDLSGYETPFGADYESEEVATSFQVIVAYPHPDDYRYGVDGIHGLHDMIEQDRVQIDRAIGLYGQANYVSGQYACIHEDHEIDRDGSAWLSISTYSLTFRRSVSASTVAAKGSNMSVSLTYRPGSSYTGLVVYNDFAALVDRMNTLRNSHGDGIAFEILIDDRDTSPATSPAAGSYDLNNTLLVGAGNGTPKLRIDEGVVFSDIVGIKNLDVDHYNTSTPVVSYSSLPKRFYLEKADISSPSGATAPFLSLAAASSSYLVLELYDNSTIGARGTDYDFIDIDDRILLLKLFGSSVFNQHSLRGNAGSSCYVQIGDAGSLMGSSQDQFAGTMTQNYGFAVKGPRFNCTTATAAENSTGTISADKQFVPVDASSPGITLTLPAQPNPAFDEWGRPVVFLEYSGANSFNIAPNGDDTINGSASTFTAAAGSLTWCFPDGESNWWVA